MTTISARKRLITLAALASAIALTATGCASSSGDAPTDGPADPVDVSINTYGIAAEFPLYLAQEKGYFTDEGVDVTFVNTAKSASDAIPLMATGQLDFYLGQPSAAEFSAANQGIGIKFVAAPVTYVPGQTAPGLVVSKQLVDSGEYTTLADLKGRKIGVLGSGSSSQYFVQLALAKAGLTLDDVEFVNLAFADMVPALASGSIAAAWESEPFYTLAVSQGDAVPAVGIGDVAAGFPFTLDVSPQFAQDHPDAVTGVVAAVLKGAQFYQQAMTNGGAEKEEVIDALVEYTAQKDRAAYDNQVMPAANPDGVVQIDQLEDFQDFLISAGSLKAPADIPAMYDDQYLKAALGTK